jgi:hypothetical protein
VVEGQLVNQIERGKNKLKIDQERMQRNMGKEEWEKWEEMEGGIKQERERKRRIEQVQVSKTCQSHLIVL